MRSSFEIGVKLTLNLEGEGQHTNDPHDPGGETYSGISRKHNPKWAGWAFIDKKDYSTASKLVRDLYYEDYWKAAGCDEVPFPMDICLFDSQVNPQNDPRLPGGGNHEILLQKPENWQEYMILRMARYMNNSKPKYVKGHIFRVLRLCGEIRKLR
jgi:lysozyme family protein